MVVTELVNQQGLQLLCSIRAIPIHRRERHDDVGFYDFSIVSSRNRSEIKFRLGVRITCDLRQLGLSIGGHDQNVVAIFGNASLLPAHELDLRNQFPLFECERSRSVDLAPT